MPLSFLKFPNTPFIGGKKKEGLVLDSFLEQQLVTLGADAEILFPVAPQLLGVF